MSPKRILRVKRVRKMGRVRTAGGPLNVSRAEFDGLIKELNERGEIINNLRRELHSTCRDLAADVQRNERDLQVQFTRIAQLQAEIDALKKRA